MKKDSLIEIFSSIMRGMVRISEEHQKEIHELEKEHEKLEREIVELQVRVKKEECEYEDFVEIAKIIVTLPFIIEQAKLNNETRAMVMAVSHRGLKSKISDDIGSGDLTGIPKKVFEICEQCGFTPFLEGPFGHGWEIYVDW